MLLAKKHFPPTQMDPTGLNISEINRGKYLTYNTMRNKSTSGTGAWILIQVKQGQGTMKV